MYFSNKIYLVFHYRSVLNKWKLYILFFFTSNFSFSQSLIIGSVKDISTNNNIPFCNVAIATKPFGTITDSFGKFKLVVPDSLLNNELLISRMGYEKFKIEIKDILNKEQIFYLNENPEELPIIKINAKRNNKLKVKTIGSKKKQNEGFYNYSYGWQVALFLKNDKGYKGYISKVMFFITNMGCPNTPFRVNIYDVSRNGEPGTAILSTSITVSGSIGEEWVIVDVLNQGIEIPKNGFFVAMEWLPISEDKQQKLNTNSQNLTIGQVLGATNEFGMEGLTWVKKFLGAWTVPVIPTESVNIINAKIGAELLIYKKKYAKEDSDPG